MKTLRLTTADFELGPYYSVYSGEEDLNIEFAGHVVIEGDLGRVRFPRHLRVEGGLGVEPGTDVEAQWGIVAGSIDVDGGLLAGWGIEAGLGIRAGDAIRARDSIRAGWGIESGATIEAGQGIEAGWYVDAAWSIESRSYVHAGWGIRAGWGLKAAGSVLCNGALDVRYRITADPASTIGCDHLLSGEIVSGHLVEAHPAGPVVKKSTSKVDTRRVFQKAIEQNRTEELFACLQAGGTAAMDARSGQLVLTPKEEA